LRYVLIDKIQAFKRKVSIYLINFLTIFTEQINIATRADDFGVSTNPSFYFHRQGICERAKAINYAA